MATKVVSDKDSFLNSFVELRKQDPMNYPRIKDILVHAKLNKHRFAKHFTSAKDFYTQGEEYLKKAMPKAELALLSERGKPYNPLVTANECIKDLRALQQIHPFAFFSRTKYRNLGRYPDSVWTKFFGNMAEFRKQAGLELSRHQHALEKHIAKQVSNDHYKEYFSREVLPYHNKYQVKQMPEKIKSFLIGSDMHDEEIDEFCLEVFLDTALRMQPNHIILNGDIFDLYEFSNFGKDLRKVRIVERFKFVHERIFKALRDRCPDAQIDFFMGNHEYRLLRLLADQTPNLRVLLADVLGLSFAKIFGLDEFKINWVSKLDLGSFTKADIKNQLRKNYRVYYDCYVVTHEPDTSFGISGTNGHHHKAMLSSFNSPLHGEMTWVQTPGMHVSDAEYLGNMSKWNTGFNLVHVNTETKEVVQNIIQTHDWAVVNGILYERKV